MPMPTSRHGNKFSFSRLILGNYPKRIYLKRGLRYTASVSIACKSTGPESRRKTKVEFLTFLLIFTVLCVNAYLKISKHQELQLL